MTPALPTAAASELTAKTEGAGPDSTTGERTVDLFALCEVRAPGQRDPLSNGGVFWLAPGTGVRRLTFGLHSPLTIASSGNLVLRFHSPASRSLRCDIIRGDVGFPEFRLYNANGTVFRFKRGNFKDFFDFSDPNRPQRVTLPLAAFIFDVDLASNVRGDGDFFASPIVKLCLDFLPDPEERIDICVADAAIEPAVDAPGLPLQDLLHFEAVDKSSTFPLFLTESPRLTFAVAINPVGLALMRQCNLQWQLERNGTVLAEGQTPLSAAKVYLGWNLPHLGPYTLLLAAEVPGQGTLRSRIPLVRCQMLPGWEASKLGISDQDRYDRIANLGGTFDRLVLNLSSIVRDGQGLRFAANRNALPRARPLPGRKRIISLKSMPRFLSRRPEQADFFRYGPSDLELYAQFIAFVVREIVEIGAWALEVWNEASVVHEWNDDLATLVELHRITYETAKKIAPDLQILGGCTNSWDPAFLREFLQAGGGRYCDGLAVHGYTYQHAECIVQFDAVCGLLQDFPVGPDGNGQIHITEIGFRHPAYSLTAQAENLVLYSLEALSRPEVGSILWFRYQNIRPENEAMYDQTGSTGYAMVGYGERYVRPMAAAYRFLLHALRGKSVRRLIRGTSGEAVYLVDDPQGSDRSIHVYFCPEGRHAALDSAGRGAVLDLYGEPVTAATRGVRLLYRLPS